MELVSRSARGIRSLRSQRGKAELAILADRDVDNHYGRFDRHGIILLDTARPSGGAGGSRARRSDSDSVYKFVQSIDRTPDVVDPAGIVVDVDPGRLCDHAAGLSRGNFAFCPQLDGLRSATAEFVDLNRPAHDELLDSRKRDLTSPRTRGGGAKRSRGHFNQGNADGPYGDRNPSDAPRVERVYR